MNAILAAAGPLGVPVTEELLRALWGIDTLYYDPSEPHGKVFEKFQHRVSFHVRPVPSGDWGRFWASLTVPQGSVLFLIGCPEPSAQEALRFEKIYALQAGLLPAQAGPDAARWALFRGDKKTGVTLYRRGEKPYCGELLFQESTPVAESDDAECLENALKDLAIKTVRVFWEVSTRAQLVPRGNILSEAVGGPWANEPVPWGENRRVVHDFVRASAGVDGGACVTAGARRVFIKRTALPAGDNASALPGQVVSLAPFYVATGAGAVELVRVQPPGEAEMDGAQWARRQGLTLGTLLK